jgi:O-antigen/teichoic acid export membrane protein
LQNEKEQTQKQIIKAIYPNAVKLGLTSLGAFMIKRASIIIGSLYLTLETIASYGITVQIITILASISSVYLTTYQPQIAQYRIKNEKLEIKHIYTRGSLLLLSLFIVGGIVFLFGGNWALELIKSKTSLLGHSFIFVALLIFLLETNHGIAAQILLTRNEVPFFRASIFSGILTLILLFVFLKYTSLGVWGLILAQGVSQVVYQNWKWPLEVMKDLNL